MSAPGIDIPTVFSLLDGHYGPQHWWPAESAFEVMAGAVLTQNTSWRNVEKAIAALRSAALLEPAAMATAEPATLAALIRSAGYFNVKAARLQALCRWLLDNGGIEGLGTLPPAELRRRLLAVHGIGPETADDILLYAFGHPVFVIDAYTRRLFGRLGLVDARAGYEQLRTEFERSLPADAALYNQYHALIVSQAKAVCRRRPLCGRCCLARFCPTAVTG